MAPRKSEKEKELADRERLTRMSRRYHAEQLEQALAGIHSDVMTRLMAQLEDLRSARALADTRAIALFEINRAITALRERQKLPPINDALPGEPLTAFQIIREIITKVSPPSREKANPKGVSG